jgi:serine protease Do
MKPILAATCEDKVAPRYPISPLSPGGGNPLRFLVQDPFGLRRAIVPVLLSNGEHLIGSGTAFHVDHFGTLVTADHVISAIREGKDFGQFEPNVEKRFDLPPTNSRPFVWLGGIMVFGHAALPEGMLVGVNSVRSPLRKLDDPMAALTGRGDSGIAADVAILKIEPVKQKEWLATLPIRLSGWRPRAVHILFESEGIPLRGGL